jgi:hypothetical protein
VGSDDDMGESASGAYVASRYRLDERLGRGGVATVYRAYDEAASRHVALKLLLASSFGNAMMASLFEREFYTLSQLAHPRIIEVYDYGLSDSNAYYTMELLDGADFIQLAPLEWKRACALLRDLASSLALLHSRRLLHRDISSRNARCTKDGRAKLFDFGAMAPFGTAARVVGTPPFVAPEVLNHQPLDQRSDLYALGALAYWLIAKRYAYRAHFLSQLAEAWQTRPPELSDLNPQVPRALNDLIMSLLSLDRASRPFYATEVVEVLSACGNLEPDDSPEIRQAYLTTPRLTGRESIIDALRKTVNGLHGGVRGQTLLLAGPSGIGRSRLLAELVLQSKVVGSTVLATGADLCPQSDYGVIWELIEQSFESIFEIANEAMRPHLQVLQLAFPELPRLMASRPTRAKPDETSCVEMNSSELAARREPAPQFSVRDKPYCPMPAPANREFVERRSEIQKALLDWFVAMASRSPLVIAVDDYHLIDEPSAALLSVLASKTRDHRFVLAATVESGVEAADSPAKALFYREATQINIDALSLEAVEGLLQSIFGDTPNTRLLADRIYAISKGNARWTMQLAQHLVDQGEIRYHSGGWTLPSHIDQGNLPNSLTEALTATLNRLSPESLELARTMALSADHRFTMEECLCLADHGEAARLTLCLNELVTAEVLVTEGLYYAVSNRAWVSALTDVLDEPNRRARHLRLADVAHRRGNELFAVADHLLGAGRPEQALDRFLHDYQQFSEQARHHSHLYTQHMQCLRQGWVSIIEKLIEASRRLNRPLRERFLFHTALIAHDSYGVTGDNIHLRIVIDRLRLDSGLADYFEIGDRLNETDRLSRALEIAQQRYDATPESERIAPPAAAIPELGETLAIAVRAAGISFDYAFVESLPSIAPFVPLSPLFEILECTLLNMRELLASHTERAHRGYLAVLERLARAQNAELPETYHEHTRLLVMNGVGLIEANLGLSSALKWAEQLESYALFQVNAWRIRLIYHLRQGELDKADDCEKRLELLQIQNCSVSMLEGSQMFPMLLSFSVADDLIGVGRIAERLIKMADRFSAWRAILLFARGEYQRIRGDYAKALLEMDQALGLTTPSRHIVWPYLAGAYIKTLCELDRLPEAQRFGVASLNAATSDCFRYARHYVGLPLAIAEAMLGNAALAKQLSASAIQEWTALGVTGITLGYAYEACARVAIYNDDSMSYRGYAAQCEKLYRINENPPLAAKYQKMTQEARRILVGPSVDALIELADVDGELTDGLTRTESRDLNAAAPLPIEQRRKW